MRFRQTGVPVLCASFVVVSALTLSPLALAQDIAFARTHEIETGARTVFTDIEDVNGDGFEDLLVTNSASDTISFLFGNGLGDFATPVTIPSGDKPWCLELSDVDSDGHDDLVVVCGNQDAIAIHYGLGGGTFDSPTFWTVGWTPRWALIVDYDGNGTQDVLVSNYYGNDLSLLLNLGGRQFSLEPPMDSGRRPSILTSDDVNGDDDPDVFLANRSDDNVQVFLSDGLGGFHEPVLHATGRRPYYAIAGDVDQDGFKDLVVVNIIGNSISVLRGDGMGGFATHVDYPTYGSRSAWLALFDADGDGDLDVLSANITSDDITLLENDGAGVFSYDFRIPNVDSAIGAYVGDVDRDGAPDIVCGSLYAGSVSVFQNRSPLYARSGNVNRGLGEAADVLFVNGSAGDARREVHVGAGAPVGIVVTEAPAGPSPAGFCMYGWSRPPQRNSVTPLRAGLGLMVFPSASTGGTPQPRVIWNNLRHEPVLGSSTHASSAAPTTLLSIPQGLDGPRRMTLQGIIRDDGARASRPLSVTNAVIVVVD